MGTWLCARATRHHPPNADLRAVVMGDRRVCLLAIPRNRPQAAAAGPDGRGAFSRPCLDAVFARAARYAGDGGASRQGYRLFGAIAVPDADGRRRYAGAYPRG